MRAAVRVHVKKSGQIYTPACRLIEETYCLVPIHTDDKHLLGVQWEGMICGRSTPIWPVGDSMEGMIYVDAVLSFGLRSAQIIFTALLDGLEY